MNPRESKPIGHALEPSISDGESPLSVADDRLLGSVVAHPVHTDLRRPDHGVDVEVGPVEPYVEPLLARLRETSGSGAADTT